jgi:hypothetical protein
MSNHWSNNHFKVSIEAIHTTNLSQAVCIGTYLVVPVGNSTNCSSISVSVKKIERIHAIFLVASKSFSSSIIIILLQSPSSANKKAGVPRRLGS